METCFNGILPIYIQNLWGPELLTNTSRNCSWVSTPYSSRNFYLGMKYIHCMPRYIGMLYNEFEEPGWRSSCMSLDCGSRVLYPRLLSILKIGQLFARMLRCGNNAAWLGVAGFCSSCPVVWSHACFQVTYGWFTEGKWKEARRGYYLIFKFVAVSAKLLAFMWRSSLLDKPHNNDGWYWKFWGGK